MRFDPPRALAASAILLAALLASAVRAGWLQPFDVALLGRLRGLGGPAWLYPMIGLTDLGSLPALFAATALAGLLLVAAGRRGEAAWLAAIALGGRILVELVKLLVARARPPVIQHAVAVESWSFPSSHTANATITLVALALLLVPDRGRRPAFAAAALLAFAIGCSRIWLGVHWPSDVAAGWLFGIGWLALTAPAASRRG